MYQRGDLLGQGALADPGGRPLGAVPHQLVDLLPRLEAEYTQQVRHLGVGDVEPELVERVRGRKVGAQPDRAALGLAVLGAVRLGDQRGGQGMRGPALDRPDQPHPGDQVAPLVAAAELQGAAVPPVELEVVHGLQQLIAELGVANPARL